MGKVSDLGKKDTTLPYRDTFTRNIISATDNRMDEENMTRLKPKMQKVGGTIYNFPSHH
jgi:hypothetical protein